MSRASLLLATLGLLASCAAHEEAPPPAVEAGIVRIPITLQEGMPWIEAKVGGRTLRLLLDLGGYDAVALTPEALASLQPEWTGRQRRTYSIYGDSALAREYTLKQFDLGGVIFPEIQGSEDLLHDDSPVKRDGYIGTALLRRFKLIIDYPARTLFLIWPNVEPPAGYDVSRWRTLKMEDGSHGVLARSIVEGQERLLVWDTGATHCVLKTRLKGSASVRKIAGNKFITVQSLDVAGIQAGPMEFALIDFSRPEADGFIGHPFFRKHAVYVDFKSRTLAVRP